MKRTSLTIVAALALSSLASHAQSARHLFLDPSFVRDAKGAALHVNAADRREAVIHADKPWEELMISFFLTVREDKGKLRLWYICRDAENKPNLAYAESTDGIHWEKPNLGIVDYRGSKENNLVGIKFLEGTVTLDPKAKPGEEYIYLSSSQGGMARYFSPDGLNWKRDAANFVPFESDTQNVTFWDENIGKYVVYMRGRAKKEGEDGYWRTVTRATSHDVSKPLELATPTDPKEFETFKKLGGGLPIVLAADEKDPIESDIYNISAQPYPLDRRWYVGFPSFFQRETNPHNPAATNYGRVETQFAGSRDGMKWERYDRAPYVSPGLANGESSSVVYMGTGLIVRGDELWQYGTGFHSHHGDVDARKTRTDGTIYRYVQRVDGFVSLDFDNASGSCTTAPVKVDGDSLRLNVDTGGLGKIQVGLIDENGKSIPGFTPELCVPIRMNSTHAEVTWKRQPSVEPLRGKSVRLSLQGSRAKLFSFYFDAKPSAAAPAPAE